MCLGIRKSCFCFFIFLEAALSIMLGGEAFAEKRCACSRIVEYKKKASPKRGKVCQQRQGLWRDTEQMDQMLKGLNSDKSGASLKKPQFWKPDKGSTVKEMDCGATGVVCGHVSGAYF